MSEKNYLPRNTQEQPKQLPHNSTTAKNGVSSTFISWLLNHCKQMETAKIEIRNR
jgi:hypothetical protein